MSGIQDHEMDAPTHNYVCTPESEDARYSRLFRRGYGVGPIHDLFGAGVQWGAFAGLESAIDVGCGRGMALGALLNAGIKRVVGVDISSYAVQSVRTLGFEAHHVDCRELARRFGEQEFDLVWSCDMLEHLPSAWVQSALAAMRHVCRKTAIFNISTRKSITVDDRGANLHLTVQSAEWWRSQIRQAGFLEVHCRITKEDVQILLARA